MKSSSCYASGKFKDCGHSKKESKGDWEQLLLPLPAISLGNDVYF